MTDVRMVALERRSVPVLDTADVIVVGGGTAGVMGAVAAARLGAQVVMIEKTGQLGGTPIQALMASFANLFRTTQGEELVASLPRELLDRMVQLGGMCYDSAQQAIDGRIGRPFTIPFQPEIYAEAVLDMVLESGVSLYLNTVFCDVLGDHSHPDGVLVAGKSGLMAVLGRVIIDASGEADVAAAADAPSHYADGTFGCLMRIGGVDTERLMRFVDETRPWKPCPGMLPWLASVLHKPESELTEKPLWHKLVDPVRYGHAPMSSPDDGLMNEDKWAYILKRYRMEGVVYTMEMSCFRHQIRSAVDAGDFTLEAPFLEGNIGYNNDGIAFGAYGQGVVLCNIAQPSGFDATTTSGACHAQIAARKYNMQIFRFFHKYVPGFEKSFLIDIGTQAVSRYSRGIDGETAFVKEVYADKEPNSNTIYRFGGLQPFNSVCAMPYGMLVPQNVKNLLVAGKCASGAHRSRSQLSCMCMGVAAGAAAASLASLGIAAIDLDRESLQRALQYLEDSSKSKIDR